MATTLSFSPMMRHAAALQHFDDLLGRYVQADESATAFPPYNIEKHEGGVYAIVIALSGYAEKDVSITQQANKLTVSGVVEAADTGVEYLYQGFQRQAFEREFTLGAHIKVEGASLTHGLLRIVLKHELPEEAKPRIIPISGQETVPPQAG